MYLDSQLLTAMRPAIVAPIRRGQSPIMAVTAFRARTSRSAIITLPTRVSRRTVLRRATPRRIALGPALTHCYRKTCPWVSMAAPEAIAAIDRSDRRFPSPPPTRRSLAMNDGKEDPRASFDSSRIRVKENGLKKAGSMSLLQVTEIFNLNSES